MPKKWLEPISISYSAVTRPCEKGEGRHQALALLREVPERLLEPDLMSSDTMPRARARSASIGSRFCHRCTRCVGVGFSQA